MAAMTTTIAQSTGYSLAAGEGERIWIVGDTLSIKASAATTGGSLSFVECEATPGAGPPPHVHVNDDLCGCPHKSSYADSTVMPRGSQHRPRSGGGELERSA
jgi:hypothetical protein